MAGDRHAYYHACTHPRLNRSCLMRVRTHSAYRGLFRACYLCMCVSSTLLQRHHALSLLLFPLPQRQSPNFSIACSQRERWGGGWSEQEEKSGIVVKRKPRCYQPTESHQGHCHVSVSVTQLSLISPSDCCDFAAMGYSVIPFCVGTSDETQN